MEKMTFLCLLYTTLLIIPGPILGFALAKTKVGEDKRQVQNLMPLGSYRGMSVSSTEFLALVAAYGVDAILKYGIESYHDHHFCANGRGFCRARCFANESMSLYFSSLCGAYKCCR
uniref:Big defensin BD4 n=1 Tax=Mytilus galloprovincialis TaxID=29158 RepID=G4U4K1_MYTGA|nr:big defensin BD4 [Mytilus galloprovincialis]